MASRIPIYFIKLCLFWMLFFALNRMVFLVWNWREVMDVPFTETLLCFWYAIYLDVSACCYVMLIPFVMLFFQLLIKTKLFNVVVKAYVFLVVFLIAVITSSELGLYDEWGIKLHYKALAYLEQPSEVWQSAEWSVLISSIFFIIFQTGVGGYFFHRWFYQKFRLTKRNYIVSLLFLLITPCLLLLGIRGGLQPIPINQSNVYYSKHYILNVAAVNSAWNLGHSIEQNKSYMDSNPYQYYDMKDAKETVEALHATEKDTSISVLSTNRPNVVLIILESWSAGLVHSLGGEEGVTPEFDSLTKEGILFTEFYATGNRSDQGMAALFSGFPAQPTTSIIKQANKYQQLPCINKEFLKQGYHTSFYFGGQLSYGNIKSYMYDNLFDKVMEGEDFDDSFPRGRLGIPDEYIFRYHLNEMNQEKYPFFSAVFTLSSHSPYDQPMDDVIEKGGEDRPFLNSAYYTDKHLGEYFREAKKQSWYKNTLFIVVADHSHDTPQQWHVFSKPYCHIPMLFLGGALKEEYRGKPYERVCSQYDLPATLFSQLDMDASPFRWSKNMFNPYVQEFAYYAFVDGLGWIRPDNYFAYYKTKDRIYLEEWDSTANKEAVIKEGKSYLQVLFQEYLDY